jgi:hypothetical protein
MSKPNEPLVVLHELTINHYVLAFKNPNKPTHRTLKSNQLEMIRTPNRTSRQINPEIKNQKLAIIRLFMMKYSSINLNDIASVATIIGFILGLIALSIAWITLKRTNKIGSASALLAFYQASSLGWEKVIERHQANSDITGSVGDLLNTLELGACLYEEKVFTGEMRNVLGKYIRDSMAAIDSVDTIRAIKSNLMTGDQLTFRFLIRMRFSAR